MNTTNNTNGRTRRPLERSVTDLARMIWTLCRTIGNRVTFEQSVVSQILRAGTSVGANICEAQYAESRKDFIHKLKIAEKELAEFSYWLGIITTEPSLVPRGDLASIIETALNVRRMLAAAIVTAKGR